MDVTKELEDVFFKDNDFVEQAYAEAFLHKSLDILRAYAAIEGAIVVLSDLIHYKSYLCIGCLGSRFGLEPNIDSISEIDSIWEEVVFNKIQTDDLFKRHILELKFYHFLKQLPADERLKYCTDSRIRIRTTDDSYQYINHRTLYLDTDLLFSVCIYRATINQSETVEINGCIINKETGALVSDSEYGACENILSNREREILSHIQCGHLSKEIAVTLAISKNTVDRHRQNILKKLGVDNSYEALKIAQAMHLL